MGRRRWVEASCSRWFILSAKHGLVAPDDVLDPYDETLTTKGLSARRYWSVQVMTQLRNVLGDLSAYEFEVHAGAAYSEYGLRSGLVSAGAVVRLPTEGLSLGKQLAFYRDGRPA